jgi:hypothetical protein
MVNAIRIHHAVRLMSWSRLAATAIPGMNRTTVLMVSSIANPPNKIASSAVAATETSKANNVQYQYSDRLDLVLKSKYLLNPDEIAWVNVIVRAISDSDSRSYDSGIITLSIMPR